MILETKISYFDATDQIEASDTITVGEALELIENGDFKTEIDKVRAGNKDIKKKLPTIAFHGLFDGFRKKADFIEASGLIILDIDDVEDDLEDVKEDIMNENPHVLAAMISPSGNGIKLLYRVHSDLINADNYRQIGKQVVQQFKLYGDVDYLSITDCLIMTYDPNIRINEKAKPAYILISQDYEEVGELEKLDESRELWDDPQEFFETVLENDIAAKTNNNFHFIQVSVLDLARYGFKHPQQDLSFVIDAAEYHFKKSADNEQRFAEVAELANHKPQLKWPYRLGARDEDDEDEDDIDYTAYAKGTSTDSNNTEEHSGEDEDGLISYENLIERVMQRINQGDRIGEEISLKNFADAFRFDGTGILTVTGIPGHGKTEMVDQIMIDLARLHGRRSLVIGFEQSPEEHLIKLIRKMVGTNITCKSYWSNPDNLKTIKVAHDYVTNMIKHINTGNVGGNIQKLLKLAAKVKAEHDFRYLVIDPFNMLSIKGKFFGHEKIEEILRLLTHFSHQMGVMVILVAHPFKMKKDEKTGEYEIPDFYSVKGSSAFFEMSYHGITVYRRANSVLVRILKVKQNNLGEAGADVWFMYDRSSGRYIPIDADLNEMRGDHYNRDWLNKAKS